MDLTPAQQAALEASELKPCLLVYLDMLWPDPGNGGALTAYPVRLWTGMGDLTPGGTGDTLLDGHTFTGAGDMLDVSSVRETGDIASVPITIGLNALKPGTLDLVLAKYYRHRKGYIWLAFGEVHTHVWTVPPIRVFGGRMDSVSMSEDAESASIRMRLESHLSDLRVPRVIRYTHASQQRLHPGDLTFQRIHDVRDKEVYWGQPDPA